MTLFMNWIRNKGTYYLLLLLLFCCNIATAQLSDNDMVAFIPTATQHVSLYWKDDKGNILGSLMRLKQYTESKKQPLVFAMNGGMYTEERMPQGLFIQSGKVIEKLNSGNGYGNFYLKPNGIFYITSNGKGNVCQSADFRIRKNMSFATQSGPMLIINGKIHEAFKAGSANVNIRNGVGILPDGKMLFVMSKKEVNLYDFAAYFKKKGCVNALYLDGFVSRSYYPAIGWLQTDGNFGVMIGVTE